MIELIFDFAVSKLIGINVLILIILAIRPFVLKYLNANIAYSLWIMIPVFILLPVNLQSGAVGNSVFTFLPGAGLLDSSAFIDDYLKEHAFKNLSLITWLTGFVTAIAFNLFRFQKIVGSLSTYDYQISTSGVELKENFSSKLKIVNSSLISTPAVFGLFNAHLILPPQFNDLPQAQQSMILRHELYHFARHDHQLNVFRIFIKCLFWFNPLAYWADKFCEADQEISCDLGVIKNQNNLERQNYAQTLIESVSGKALEHSTSNCLLSQWKYHSSIKERVKMLKYIKSKKWHSWVAAIFAAITLWTTNSMVMAEKSALKEVEPTDIVQPRYPRAAAEQGVEGWVKLGFNVDKSGKTYNIRVIKSKPAGVFDYYAMRAVKQWEFAANTGQENLIYTLEFELPKVAEE